MAPISEAVKQTKSTFTITGKLDVICSMAPAKKRPAAQPTAARPRRTCRPRRSRPDEGSTACGPCLLRRAPPSRPPKPAPTQRITTRHFHPQCSATGLWRYALCAGERSVCTGWPIRSQGQAGKAVKHKGCLYAPDEPKPPAVAAQTRRQSLATR